MNRHFVLNLAIGFALLVALHTPWVEHNRAVTGMRDAVMNWQMDRLSGLDTGARLAWIDIDEAAHRAWGVPSFTRRDKLAALIGFALKGRPRAVVVDIDLADSMPGMERGDAVLRRVLVAHERSCTSACTPILLVRTMETSSYRYANRDGAALAARPSFLDRPLGTSPKQPWNGRGIYWGTAGMDQEPDRVTRRWRLWENSCSEPGTATVTPSVTLLAAAVASGVTPQAVRNALEPHALTCEPLQSAIRQVPVPDRQTRLIVGGSTLPLSEEGATRRIFFRIPWSQSANGDRSLAVVLSAGEIAKHPSAPAAILDGRIVVIGASNSASGDLHVTPIGVMPGSLVMINAINSILNGDEIREPGWPLTILMEVCLIFLVSWLFVRFSVEAALSASLAAVALWALTIGLAAFNMGVWIDSVIPALGVIAHEFAARAHHGISAMLQRRLQTEP
jgi:CHASE2 domain-containing sensor protein